MHTHVTETHIIERIHQVVIVDGLKLPKHISSAMQLNSESLQQVYPAAKYHLWSGEQLRTFIGDAFRPAVLQAFDTLRPYSYKCDLARFCLLFAQGGMYVDLAVRVLDPWRIPASCGIAAFSEFYPGMKSWTCIQTSVLWAKPGRPEMERAIEWIVGNCEKRYYGPHDHYPTAGALLGRAFAAAMAAKRQNSSADDQWVGEIRYITPEQEMKNVCYIAPDRTSVGIRTKTTAGDLGEIGLSGTNNYCDIWRARQVYGETEHVWKGDDVLLVPENGASRSLTGISIPAGTVGRVMYGPFVNLQAGSYRMRFSFGPNTIFQRLLIDVCSGYATNMVEEFKIDMTEDFPEDHVDVYFTLGHPHKHVEFRMYVFGDFVGELQKVILIPVDERVWDPNHEKLKSIGVARTDTGIAIPAGTIGRVVYGPYVDVAPGTYCVTASFSPETRFSRLLLEVCTNCGTEIVETLLLDEPDSENRTEAELLFSTEKELTAAEFRLEVFGDFQGEFRKFTLNRQQPQPSDEGVEGSTSRKSLVDLTSSRKIADEHAQIR
jgi:Glycosyltransferase sugar-binding region containing DXD motif